MCRDVKTEPKQPPRLGGNRAALFAYAIAGIDVMAFFATGVSLVTYFYGYMNFSITESATAVTNFMGTAFFLSLFGAFLSDTYLSRFKTCVLFGCIEVVGYALLAVQAHFRQLRPFPCKDVPLSQINQSAPPLGADQYDEKDPKEAAKLSSYFNWLMFFLTTGALFGVTFVVWISENQGWDWSFAVCSIVVGFAILFLTLGKSLYRNNVTKGSPLTRIMQVFVVALRNRNLRLPENEHELHEIQDKEARYHTEILQKTEQFKFLDRAAINRTDQEASTSNAHGPWKLCTVTQVEETKIVIRMLPIILSTVFMNTCLAQLQTFTIQQSTTMDRNIHKFEVPGASIPAIPLLFMIILIPIYERVFIPIARKFTGIPTGIRQLQRIGIGLVLSSVSMAVAAIIEKHRKSIAIKHNMVESAAPLPMSVFWLGYQYAIFGLADMFTLVGLLDFFYSESSSSMKALSTAISWSSLAIGYYTSSIVVSIVNKVSGGWLANNNLNKDKLDYFYWLLAGLSVLNFGFYLLCASWYKYKKIDMNPEDEMSIV
ncbi:hypothetical protein EJD97_024013 [Solanum chilense]|uniref:Major facilitator superfamily (MFS) profile domain-containing protein n=1 Tax=Solanum chilense TaxID=4083 RepID=A0A6N2ARP9_SOLCI|nr:hypothetical protein EJD97_024013 [Solanum chilense]